MCPEKRSLFHNCFSCLVYLIVLFLQFVSIELVFFVIFDEIIFHISKLFDICNAFRIGLRPLLYNLTIETYTLLFNCRSLSLWCLLPLKTLYEALL